MTQTPTEQLTRLRENLIRHFGAEELRTLCADLGVDYDDLPGEGKSAKGRELVAYMDRRGRIAELAQKGSELRPNVAWGEIPQAPAKASTPTSIGQPDLSRPAGDDLASLERALAMARRTQAILEEQTAGYTSLTVPVHLKIELEEKRRQVAELEARLTQPPQPTPAPSPARPASRYDVFMSYSRKDTDMMRRLLQDLRAQGLTVWVDQTDLEPGTPAWETAIGNAIENSRCTIVILSPDAKESTWVTRELSYSEDHGLRIFPVLARGDERDAIPFRLSSTQRIDMRRDYAGGVQTLVVAVHKHLGM